MHKKQFSRVCLTNTVYSLLLYLLYSSEEEIDKTFFFFGQGIDQSIRKNFFDNHYFFPGSKKFRSETNKTKRRIRTLLYLISISLFAWVMRRTHWSFLEKADYFVQDHLHFSGCIIGRKNYTLLEDAPYCFRLFVPHFRRPSENILVRFFSSRRKQRAFGKNRQCNEIIITENEIYPYMEEKRIINVSLHSLWDKSSTLKRQLVMDIFNVVADDIESIRSKENILFTQCFVEDGYITPEERSRIYREIVDNYDRNTLLIKKHPRETFDYKTLFPDITLFEKPVPMHLFTLLGVHFKRAITVSSSIAASFDYAIEIDWYGTEISEDLVNKIGILKCPPTIFQKRKMQSNNDGK
jgi:hypothetical protein